ncbi:MAG: hypothetical protein IKQ61_11165 [Spirochaetales bacterium]|nr:hypothetical protein [Spirochaetales bacterium]MBR6200805.1 hypothetical protein [Spirochaetales bacterium]
MKKRLSFLFIFMVIASFCAVSAENTMQAVSDLLGRFGKMTDGLDRLRCRPADGRSIFGFYLKDGIVRIPYRFEMDNEYILLLSSAQNVECRIEYERDGRLLAEQKGSRIYMKYSAKNAMYTDITVRSDTGGDIAILIILCRDRYSLPLPFEDIMSMVRDMADSPACRSRTLTDKTDYFLLGGTFAANESDEFIISEGLVSGLRFAVGHSKTVSNAVLELHRGSGIANSVSGHGVQYCDAKTTRQARYSILYKNGSPVVFERGILMSAILEK